MRVDEGQVLVGLRDHRQRAVAEDLLEQDGIPAAAEVLGGERVAQQVRVHALLDAGRLAQGPDHLLDR